MQFKELPPKLQVCLLAGLLGAVEGELHKHKSKIAGTVNSMMQNVGVGSNDLNEIIDGLSDAEAEMLSLYAAEMAAQNATQH